MKRLRSIIIVSVGLLGLLTIVAQVGLHAFANGSQKSAHATASQSVFTRQDVFARGTNNTLLHRHSTAPNVWTNWDTLPSHQVDSSPSVVTDTATQEIDGVYRSGLDVWHFLYSPRTGMFEETNLGHACHNQPFGGFCSINGFTSAPTITSSHPGNLDVFVFGGTALKHDWFTTGDGWADWEILFGDHNYVDDPAAVSWGDNRIDVFVHISDDHQLYDAVFDGSWHSPQPLGGHLTSSPAAFAFGVGNIRVAVRDPSNTISSSFMSNGTWAPSWTSYNDGPTSAAPAITISAAGIQGADDLFEPDANGVLHLFTVSNVGTTLSSLNLGGAPILGAAAATNAPVSTVIQPVGSTPPPTPPTPTPPTPPPTPTPTPPTPTPTPLPKQCVHPPCRVEN